MEFRQPGAAGPKVSLELLAALAVALSSDEMSQIENAVPADAVAGTRCAP